MITIKNSDIRMLMVLLAVLMVSGPLSAQGVEELPPLMADDSDQPVDEPNKVNAGTIIATPGPVLPHRERVVRKVDPDGGGGTTELSEVGPRAGGRGGRSVAHLPVSGRVGDTVLVHVSLGPRGVPALVHAGVLEQTGVQRVVLPLPKGASLDGLVFHVTIVHGDGSVTTDSRTQQPPNLRGKRVARGNAR